MKICLTTFYTRNYQELADITVSKMEEYCAKHKYDLNITKISNDASFHFVKTADTRKLLDTYDVVMGIECDVLLTNLEIKVEDFLDSEHDLFITNDINGINFGVFIAKSTDWTKQLFDEINENKNGYGDEQNFMERFMHDKIKVKQHPCFNSMPYHYYEPSYGYIDWHKLSPPPTEPTEAQGNWRPTHFCCHLPGKRLTDRIAIFNEIKQLL